MTVWIASHECSGIAEAGGVKNVSFSLCKELYSSGHNTVLFIPVFKCTSFKETKEFDRNCGEVQVFICGKNETVTFSKAQSLKFGFEIVFVQHPAFEEKEAVYTYTQNEENINPFHKKGCGHEDVKFLDNLFAKAVNAYSEIILENQRPDIIHCQDASTANIPLYVYHNPLLKDCRTIVTIHNAGPAYHHEFSSIDEAAWYTGYDIPFFVNCMNEERVEPFLIASEYGALLTTVSPSYADELVNTAFNDLTDGLSGIFARKNIPVTGITNGIDVSLYDPTDTEKSGLPFAFGPSFGDLKGKYDSRNYLLSKIHSSDNEILKDIKTYGYISNESVKNESVWLVYQGRLASQKGLAVLADVLPAVLEKFPEVNVIVTGQGERELESRFINLASNDCFEGRFVFLNGYNRVAARLTVTAGDFILLPSFFEPCGLEDFIALLYGTLPVAHKTGGLNKIIDGKTGFLYEGNNKENLFKCICRAVEIKNTHPDTIKDMIKEGAFYTRNKYDWKKVCEEEYIPLFENLLK